MLSNHYSQNELAPPVAWLEHCKRHRGPDFRAIGSGRWLVTTIDDSGRGWMFETLEEAKRVIVDPKRCTITDLLGKTAWEKLEAAPEVYDADELRRERRARRAAQAQA
jgi:hypothetical protein